MKLILFLRSFYFSILSLGRKNLDVNNLIIADKILTSLQIDSIKKYLKYFPDNTELSVGFADDGKATFIGIKIEKNSLVYVENENSVFEIGSLTKVFTSILLSKFINGGLLKLDDPIKNYFDFPLKQSSLNDKEITFENLANHTSGLPRIDITMFFGKEKAKGRNPYKNYDEQKLEGYLKNKMRLKTIPGTKFRYSNLGGGLLAFILCKIANKTFEELLQSIIFVPLTMQNSTTELSKVKTELVKGLTKKGVITENWEYTDATAGAGAIKSTSLDMTHFIQSHFSENKALQLPLQKTFSVKEKTDIGLGWLITQKDNKTIHWHNGGTGGYRSCMALDLLNKKGIILLSNVSAFHPKNKNIDELCFSLLKSIDQAS